MRENRRQQHARQEREPSSAANYDRPQNLLSRHHSDILAQDLSADGKWFAGGQPGESDPRPVAERRAPGRSVDEDEIEQSLALDVADRHGARLFSTLADQVGGCCAVLAPLLRQVEAHVFAAGRLHSDDTTVPVLAKGKTDTGRCWVYVRDDRPFGGQDPRAAMFYHSRDRAGEYAQAHLADYAGIFQADAFGGYNRLYEADRKPGQIVEAACWVHARRPVFQMADLAATARRRAQGKTLRRSGALMRCSEIEHSINGQSAERRRVVRQELSASLVADLERWLRQQRAKLSRGNDLAKAMRLEPISLPPRQ